MTVQMDIAGTPFIVHEVANTPYNVDDKVRQQLEGGVLRQLGEASQPSAITLYIGPTLALLAVPKHLAKKLVPSAIAREAAMWLEATETQALFARRTTAAKSTEEIVEAAIKRRLEAACK